MILYFLLTGVHPFEKQLDDRMMVEDKVRMNERPPLPTGQSLVYLQRLIGLCWQYRPSERPSAGQVVAIMCQLAFHMQCEDLSVIGSYCIMATTSMNEEPHSNLSDIADASSSYGVDAHSGLRARAQTTSEFGQSLALRYARKQPERTSVLSKSYQDSPGFLSTQQKSDISQSSPFEIEVTTTIEEKMKDVRALDLARNKTEPETGRYETAEDRNIGIPPATSQSADLPPCSGELTIEGSSQTISFALVATRDSLLVALPQLSVFLGFHRLKVKRGDISVILFLNETLWIGQRSGELSVFDCIGGDIGRRHKQKYHCNDVIEDIQYQYSKDGAHAKVFALIANGEIVVVQGRRFREEAKASQGMNCWGRDSKYIWENPTVRKIGKIGLEEEEAIELESCMVVARPDRLWYCQGNMIRVFDTQNTGGHEPLKEITADGFASGSDTFSTVPGTITIPDMRIRIASVVGDTVWCSGCEAWSSTILAINSFSMTETGRWTLNDLLCGSNDSTPSLQQSGLRSDRGLFPKRPASFSPTAILCLATVCDTLWIGCDNGSILLTWKDGKDNLRLLATLWCRSTMDKEAPELPPVVIIKISQVGDRVLVYHKTLPVSDKTSETTVVAEVFQAFDSSQIQELTTYYDVQNA